MPRRTKPWLAIVVPAALSVCCPACGAPQPNPDTGGDMWTAEEVRDAKGTKRDCVSCGCMIVMRAPARVAVDYR